MLSINHALADKISQLLSRDFVRQNVIFFIGTILISIFNYLYYPVLARIVSVTEFGEIQAIIAIFVQIGVFLTAYGYAITNIVANTEKIRERNTLIFKIEQLTLAFATIFFLVTIIAIYATGNNLKVGLWPTLAVGLLILFNVPLAARQFILQGERHLKEVSIGGVVFALGKLLLTIILVYMFANNVSAVMLAYVLALLIALVYFQAKTPDYIPLMKSLHIKISELTFARLRSIKSELYYMGIITIILFGLTLLYMSDTIFARLFFDEHTQGLYSGVSSVAKIVFFVTASVSGVLIANVKINDTIHERRRILRHSLAMIGLLGGGVTIAFALFPSFFVVTLMSTKFSSVSALLPLLSIVMLFSAFTNLLAIYQIALRKYAAIIPIALGCTVLLFGLMIAHDTLTSFIGVYLAANITTFVLLFIQIVRGINNGKKAADIDCIA